MRFITEDDLRAAYKKHPFPSYETKAGERLTPGGRQFLNDRGVKIKDSVETAQPMDGTTHQAQDKASPIHGAPYPLEEAIIRSVRARFLEAGASLLDMDVLAAREIFELERSLAGITQEMPDSGPPWASCTGITQENRDSQLEDCFEVTGFHVQSPRGREIALLHCLRCELRILSCTLPVDKK